MKIKICSGGGIGRRYGGLDYIVRINGLWSSNVIIQGANPWPEQLKKEVEICTVVVFATIMIMATVPAATTATVTVTVDNP